ncbi:tRNA 2-thiouridine(34) synthase MnmA [Candidatus Babeliales bacterium]|nr:tRNA 2-thiouridine(34) synthase MnmA [Candidatus Babeliales bacterium]MCF7899525.1 tRNA 2-thiouridine(34) synthase MnmA [Candidatus Babeliales bacterium]
MKIAALVSGGVDSSVALALLKEQKHDITAFYLKIWLEDDLAFLGDCPWEQDLFYVEKVCKQLDVPLKIINMQQEYWDKIVSYTINEVQAGRTPSPDIFCNQKIKFGCFYEKIDKSFEKVATGHYAILEETNNKFILKKSKDLFKDQTYFLSHLNQEQLKRAMFPIGNLLKSEVRDLAKKFNLPNKDRKDSQGICFLGKIKFSDFIKHHLGTKPGDLIEIETGKKLGQHEGFWCYTIGQRKGIGLSGGPWYVVAKDPEKNIVYISSQYFTPDKKRDKLTVSDFNWINGTKPEKTEDLSVKIRHGQDFYKCKLEFLEKNKALVTIDGQDQGLAQGQFAVFYDQDICLGCGVIS